MAKSKSGNSGTKTGAASGEEIQVQINIIAQYAKDLSFEAPGSPAIFQEMQNTQPDVNININVRAAQGKENIHEVVLHIDATCKVGGKTAYVAELDFGGLVQVTAPIEHMQMILMVEVPRMLFPFARNIIAEVTRDGGFMPLMMVPVDFFAMLRDSVSSQASDMATAIKGADKA